MKHWTIILIIFLLRSVESNGQTNVISFYDSSGVLNREKEKMDKLHGTIHYSLRDSLIDGEWVVYYNNDTTKPLIKCHYSNKVKHGEYRKYYFNGNIQSQGYYSNGLKSGLWKGFRENGKIGIEFFIESKEIIVSRTMNKYGEWVYSSKQAKRKFEQLLKIEKKDTR